MSWLSGLTQGTLLHAINGSRLAEEAINMAQLTFSEQIKVGAWSAAKLIPLRLISGLAIKSLIDSCADCQQQSIETSSKETPSKPTIPQMMHRLGFFKIAILKPIQEELIFRGGIELAIYGVQQVLKNSSYAGNGTLTGTSARILAVSAIYAAAHFKNLSALSPRTVVSQSLSLLAFPLESILRETAGLPAAIAAHVTYNTFGYLFCRSDQSGSAN